jgi:predicted Fe-Mo cluster-binding NifX family protein
VLRDIVDMAAAGALKAPQQGKAGGGQQARRYNRLRIALFYGAEDFVLRPLKDADVLAIIDEEQKVVEQYENPAPKFGEEAAIQGILELGASAVIVRDDTLSENAYKALKGHVKFMVTELKDLYQILDILDELKSNATDEIKEMEVRQSS